MRFINRFFLLFIPLCPLLGYTQVWQTKPLDKMLLAQGKSDVRASNNNQEKRPQQEIKKLLILAEKQLSSMQLTLPVGNNAYESYQRVLKIDQNNNEAKQGLVKIADRYQKLAEQYEERGLLQKSLRMIEIGLRVMPNHSGLLAQQAVIEEALLRQEKTGRRVGKAQNRVAEDLPFKMLEQMFKGTPFSGNMTWSRDRAGGRDRADGRAGDGDYGGGSGKARDRDYGGGSGRARDRDYGGGSGRARDRDYGGGSGRARDNVDVYSLSNEVQQLTKFPWPPPRASATEIIPRKFLEKKKEAKFLRDVDSRISQAIKEIGYYESSYYAAPKGFAMVTRMEQIEEDGSPKKEPQRWSLESQSFDEFTLTAYLKALFLSKPGYYRVIVFVVTPYSLTQSSVDTTPEEAKKWLSEGHNRLPEPIGKMEFLENYTCTALIYEFERQTESEEPRFRQPGRIPGYLHLVKSGIWQALEQ